MGEWISTTLNRRLILRGLLALSLLANGVLLALWHSRDRVVLMSREAIEAQIARDRERYGGDSANWSVVRLDAPRQVILETGTVVNPLTLLGPPYSQRTIYIWAKRSDSGDGLVAPPIVFSER